MEIPYLTNYVAARRGNEITVVGARGDELPDVAIVVLELGRIVFNGNLQAFQSSELPSVKRMLTLDSPAYEMADYVKDPWDKSRVIRDKVL